MEAPRTGARLVRTALAAALVTTTLVTVPAHGQDAAVTVLGGPVAVAPVVDALLARCTDAPPQRVAGTDRYETAALLARTAGTEGSPVVVATGADFPDALAAGASAVRGGAVLLLTRRDELPEPTREAIGALRPSRILVVGGTASISAEVERELAKLAPTQRVSGTDRYATAAALARRDPTVDAVYLTTGEGFADAVAASGAAGSEGAPVVLTRRDTLPEPTREVLEAAAPSEVVIVGGSAAVSIEVEAEVERVTGATVTRLAGADRVATAVAVGRHVFPDAPGAVLASGRAFPDALAAAPLVAARSVPLLLVTPDDLPVGTGRELAARGLTGSCAPLEVRVHEDEAVGLYGRARLQANWEGLWIRVGAGRGAGLLVPGEVALTFSYPPPLHAPDLQVSWEQTAAAPTVLARQPWRGQRALAPGGWLGAWQALGSTASSYREQIDAAPGLDVTSPFTWRLRADGSVTGAPDAVFNRDMEARGIAVWPAFVSAGAPDHVHDTFSDAGTRRRVVAQLSQQARDTGAEGINVDVEGFHDRSRAVFVTFLRELTEAVHAWGGVVSVDVTGMHDSWATPPEGEYAFWSTALDRRAIAELADYTVLMAYDEHHRLRAYGPIASPPWVEEVLAYQLRFTDPDRLILGIPFYGAVWTPGRANPSYVGIDTIEQLARDGRRTWDAEHQLDRVDLPDGRFLWDETPARLRHRMQLVNDLGLAGMLGWRLGFDGPGVWRTLAG